MSFHSKLKKFVAQPCQETAFAVIQAHRKNPPNPLDLTMNDLRNYAQAVDVVNTFARGGQ